MSKLETIINLLGEIADDRTVPRNVRSVIEEAKTSLEDDSKEMDVRLNSVISNLDEITNDPNIPMYTRTQIWNVVSMLESIHEES
ncbi:MAG: hypothetical protein GF368_03715 [Candidatus Aenigmarchaeota archaeon]|nr:hypothetical protein [Candidatus Aenigmarchaeota archaeon]